MRWGSETNMQEKPIWRQPFPGKWIEQPREHKTYMPWVHHSEIPARAISFAYPKLHTDRPTHFIVEYDGRWCAFSVGGFSSITSKVVDGRKVKIWTVLSTGGGFYGQNIDIGRVRFDSVSELDLFTRLMVDAFPFCPLGGDENGFSPYGNEVAFSGRFIANVQKGLYVKPRP